MPHPRPRLQLHPPSHWRKLLASRSSLRTSRRAIWLRVVFSLTTRSTTCVSSRSGPRLAWGEYIRRRPTRKPPLHRALRARTPLPAPLPHGRRTNHAVEHQEEVDLMKEEIQMRHAYTLNGLDLDDEDAEVGRAARASGWGGGA